MQYTMQHTTPENLGVLVEFRMMDADQLELILAAADQLGEVISELAATARFIDAEASSMSPEEMDELREDIQAYVNRVIERGRAAVVGRALDMAEGAFADVARHNVTGELTGGNAARYGHPHWTTIVAIQQSHELEAVLPAPTAAAAETPPFPPVFALVDEDQHVIIYRLDADDEPDALDWTQAEGDDAAAVAAAVESLGYLPEMDAADHHYPGGVVIPVTPL